MYAMPQQVPDARKLGLMQRRVSENMTAAYMAMWPHVWPIIIVIIVFIVIRVIMTSDLYIMMSQPFSLSCQVIISLSYSSSIA